MGTYLAIGINVHAMKWACTYPFLHLANLISNYPILLLAKFGIRKVIW